MTSYGAVIMIKDSVVPKAVDPVTEHVHGPAADGHGQFAGWRMVVLASFIHNCSYGLIFGVYGVSVVAIQARFGTTRATAASALSLMMGAVIVSAPILGSLYGRLSIRRSMMLGTFLGAGGHFLLAASHDWRTMLISYAFLVGPGVALTGSMPTNVLVSNWFNSNEGRAFGIVNLPLGLMIVPMLAAMLLQRAGLTYLYAFSGIGLLMIVPAAWLLVDRPEQLGQRPMGEPSETTDRPARGLQPMLTFRALLLRWDFWLITISIGIIVGAAAMKQAHLVPPAHRARALPAVGLQPAGALCGRRRNRIAASWVVVGSFRRRHPIARECRPAVVDVVGVSLADQRCSSDP